MAESSDAGRDPPFSAAKTNIRKRSHGSLRPIHQDREDKDASPTNGIDGLANMDHVARHTSASRGRPRTIITATVFVISTLVISLYLYQRYIPTSFRQSTQPVLQHSNSNSTPTLDYVLHPEDHIHRSPTTLHYEWTISSGLRRPDGVLKEVYLINDEFLGPTIECRSGDKLVINVRNTLSDDGIGMHWHGLYMRGANDMDGAVGFTQDPIEPGSNFTYEFVIADDQQGSFWYHAHDGVQRADGLFGALIVHRPADADHEDHSKYQYDEERLLMIGDWYHRTAKEVMSWYMRAASFGNEPVPDSVLLNGIGAYNCSMAVPARPVDCEQYEPPGMALDASKRYRLRLINVGNLGSFSLSVSGASLTAIQVDGGNEIEGRKAVSVGLLHPGQRADMIIETEPDAPDPKQVQLTLARENFKYPNPALTVTQSFGLSLSGESQVREGSVKTSKVQNFDLDGAKPKDAGASGIPEVANMTMVLYTSSPKLAHLDNEPHGFINRTSWKPQASPPGHLLSLPRAQWDKNQFVPHIPVPSEGAADFWVDLVLNNLDDGSHPFHLHGYDFWSLQTHAGFGWGSWNPFETAEPPGGLLNTRNPVRRDTVYVPKRGYTVLRFKANNPGIWMFHCHLLWHQASGMSMGLQVGDHE